jgi:hypothetical protein
VTKICSSFVRGSAQVGGNPHRQELAVQGVSHSIRVHREGEIYWRFISGFDPMGCNLGRPEQIGQFMQRVQLRINTGDCASR